MYTLKSIARRGTMLGAAFALFAAVVVPSASVFADALNPLTQRSLLLTSSAPGYQNSDGSGNSEYFPNAIPEYYSPPGSGPNGEKTGETFTFRVSTDSVEEERPIQGFSFQYCTTAAGYCQGPGNNQLVNGGNGDARNGVYDPDENATGRATNAQAHPLGYSDLDVVYPNAEIGTDFNIFIDLNNDGDYADVGEQPTEDWELKTYIAEDDDHSGKLTGKQNYIALYYTGDDDGLSPVFNSKVQIVFKASTSQYITNPGADEFFVKINTYDTNAHATLFSNNVPTSENPNIIDGGVTVANVMTDSIHITTKVLETMSFSVGTQNRDNWEIDCEVGETPECQGENAVHGTCDPIEVVDNNRLQLGNPDAEYSLETGTAWDVYSYWRLSSNSSGGATVYYSGNTLQNTVGDTIQEIGPTKAASTPGTEQFGIGFVDAHTDDLADIDPALLDLQTEESDRYKPASLHVLTEETNYADGAGTINGVNPTARFAFEAESNTIPKLIAQDADTVISCDTAKMRYVANIGADTPAGVYTTKINYLAAPQY